MGETTGIGWCDSTFNPWIGCAKVSPGCAHCYAETLVTGRMAEPGLWGDDGGRRRTSASNWREPLKWERKHLEFEAIHGHRRRVFCASLADVFEPRLSLDPWRHELMRLIEKTPNLDWLLLTKRPDYAKAFLVDGRAATPQEVDDGCEFGWVPPYYYDGRAGDSLLPVPLPNVWLGVSIENSRFTYRADILRQIPAAIRFISAEPLLASLYPAVADTRTTIEASRPLDLSLIDWIIIGGESGPDARPFGVAHANEILWHLSDRDPHAPMNPWPDRPAVFVKQLGARPFDATGHPMGLRHRKGEDINEWPQHLRIQEHPR